MKFLRLIIGLFVVSFYGLIGMQTQETLVVPDVLFKAIPDFIDAQQGVIFTEAEKEGGYVEFFTFSQLSYYIKRSNHTFVVYMITKNELATLNGTITLEEGFTMLPDQLMVHESYYRFRGDSIPLSMFKKVANRPSAPPNIFDR